MERLASLLPEGEDTDVHRGARRSSPRHSFHADVELLDPRSATGIVINASAGGMRIVIDEPLDVGVACIAKVVTAAGKELYEKARVVWTREEPDGYIVGLAFIQDN